MTRHLRFNALAGIFAFRTQTVDDKNGLVVVFQCPRGHFCFSDIGSVYWDVQTAE